MAVNHEMDYSAASGNPLQPVREELNRVDDQLIALFKKRMELSEEVARVKIANGIPVLNQGREDEVITRLTAGCGEGEAAYIRELYLKIFELSRDLQEKFIADRNK